MDVLHAVATSIDVCDPALLATDRAEWDALASSAATPFLSSAWLRAWVSAQRLPTVGIVARDARNALTAGAWFTQKPLRRMAGAADVHTGEWSVAATDPASARSVWRHVIAREPWLITAAALPAGSDSALIAQDELRDAGYTVTLRDGIRSPRLALPATFDDLLAGVSSNLRGQARRLHRVLAREGTLRFRTSSLDRVEADLETFLRLEASGWKGRAGTAIACRPETVRLYREFATAASREGWLRLQLLELDGRVVAADLSCVYGEGVFLVKTAFDEDLRALRPGFVLQSAALRSAIEDGHRFFDFLGDDDAYKLRWGAVVRPHVTLVAARGPARVRSAYEAARPLLVAARRVTRAAPRRPILTGRPARPGGRSRAA